MKFVIVILFMVSADIGMLSTAVDAYRDFKAQQKEELCAVQQATIASSEKLCQALGRFIMV